ncbi:MAG: N-formylglutamate amidohydrolase [Burkholderiales bacterium]|nr:N-formylglutamate amidohydrolase [Burkholderiales bacterium]
MRPPFVRHDPVVAVAPVVLDSPHSGEDYPAEFDHAPPRAIVRQAEDTHVARLWRSALAHGATLVEATFPRAWIDPNRALEDIDPALFAPGERWPGPVALTRKTELGIGLVWRLAHGGAPMYARSLTVDEVERRIAQCWSPYHDAVADAIEERHRAFGAVWHVNCHSMPAVGDVISDDPGRERADVVLGDRDGTTCEAAFTALVADAFASMGYSVAINDPYKGVELVRKHGRPAEGRHSLQVELKRTLYMDEATFEPNEGYARLQHDLARVAGRIVAHARDSLGALSVSGGHSNDR